MRCCRPASIASGNRICGSAIGASVRSQCFCTRRTMPRGIAGHRGSGAGAAGRAAIALTVARHQLHESWFRPHLPIRRTLRPLSELLAHKIGIMPYAVPIRRVEVFARPERPTRSDRPAFCLLRTEELLHRQVRPAEHPDLPRAQIVVAGRFVRFNRDAGPPLASRAHGRTCPAPSRCCSDSETPTSALKSCRFSPSPYTLL